MTALIVGQDFAVMKTMRAHLAGYSVLFATDAASGVDVAQRRQPAVIFVCIRRGSGLALSLIRHIRRQAPVALVIAVMSKPRSSAWPRVELLGADGVFGLSEGFEVFDQLVAVFTPYLQAQHG